MEIRSVIFAQILLIKKKDHLDGRLSELLPLILAQIYLTKANEHLDERQNDPLPAPVTAGETPTGAKRPPA